MFNSRVFNQGTYNYTREQLAFAILQGTGSITARAVARFVASAQLYGQGGIGAWATRRQFGSWAAMGAGSISAIARILVWAVMVEEGTTNELADGDCEAAVPTLGGVAGSHAEIATPTLDTAHKFGGVSSLKITTNATAGRVDRYFGLGSQTSLNGLTAGATYTFSVYVYIPSTSGISPSNVYLRAFDHNAVGYQETESSRATVTDAWQRLTVTRTIRSDADAIFFRVEIYQDITNASIYVDNLQVEQKAYVTSFHPSTRSPETLTIPTAGVLNPAGPYTLEAYSQKTVRDIPPFVFFKDWSNYARFGYRSDYDKYELELVKNGTTVFAVYSSVLDLSGFVQSTLVFTGTKYIGYANGQKVCEVTSSEQIGADWAFTPGNIDGFCINGLIDNLRISSRARTDAEIQAVYQNRELLVWDEYTTYLLEYNNNLNFPVNRAGNWIILHDLGITPDEINFSYVANVPSGHIITREYATNADGVGWSEWQDIPASGTVGCARYVKIKLALSGTDLSNFWVDQYNLVYNAEFANPQLIYSDLTPGVYVCFTSYAGRAFFCAKCRPLIYDGSVVRPVGVDPPGTAPTLAVGAAGSLSGAYKGKVTFVNADNIESNPSPASDAVSVTDQEINWTIPTGPDGTAKRKLYRTKAGGNVYYEVAEINDNTTTSYEDNLVDSSLVELMEDDNNIPPVSSLVYSYKDYMFYVSADDESQVWYSKPARPEQVPNITGKQFFKQAMGPVRLLKAFHDALIVSGMGFTQAIFGTVFTSDITLDNTTTKFIDSVGALSHDAATVCVDPRKQRLLAMVLETGELAFIMPGLQEETLQAYPASRDVAPIFRQAILRHKTAIAYYGGQLYVSLAWHKPGGVKPTVNNTVLCYDFVVGRWQGIINSKVSHIISTPRGLYLVSAEEGIVNKLSESQFLPLILDSNYQGNIFGINALTRISNLRLIVSNDSVTDNTKVKIKVDNNEYIVSVGSKNSWDVGFWEGGDYGYGRQDAVVSPRFPVYVPIGRMFGWRLEDSSENPLTVYAVVLECEPVYFM